MANKKSKLKKTKKQNNKKSMIIIISMILLLLIVVSLVLIFNRSKKIECSKISKDNKITMNSDISLKLKNNKINIINVTKEIKVNDDTLDYASIIKNSLEETYKSLGVDYDITTKGKKIIIKLTYDKEKEYILDNIDLDLQDDGMSIDIISEDREDNYALIDMSKEYTYDKVIKILKKADYECK